MKRRRGFAERSALELVEESFVILRRLPATAWVSYYAGTAPFVLGLLFFWADMSRGAFAWQHATLAALGMALLYVWMKSWHAGFARQVYAVLEQTPPAPWSADRLLRLVATQTFVQPTALILLPLACVLVAPIGWVFAFYHNLALYGDGRADGVWDAVRRAARQTVPWVVQQHMLQSILIFFGMFVFLNILTGAVLLPVLLKSLLGVQTPFSMSPWTFLNTTFLATMLGLTYLGLNPLIKTAYIVRCFHCESRATGADLKAALRALAVGIVLLVGAPASRAAEPVPPTAAELDQTIDHVISQPQYTWRLPREEAPVDETSWWGQFTQELKAMFKRWSETFERWNREFRLWLERLLRRWFPDPDREPGSLAAWALALEMLSYLLAAAMVLLIGVLLVRAWRQHRHAHTVAEPVPAAEPVNLADANLLASQLPVDGWLAKAQELIAVGELRLALRALYLASLAHLADRELIRIARFKSNRDYERELRRRAAGQPPLLAAFAANVTAFEAAWYGLHEVTPTGLAEFQTNLDQIRRQP
jgi:hypothetical protein